MFSLLGWGSPEEPAPAAAPAPAPAAVYNIDFFKELHDFFNKAVINFDSEERETAPTLESYQSRIITSLSVLETYPTLKPWAALSKIGTPERDPVIALESIFNPATQDAFQHFRNREGYDPGDPRNYLETKLLMNAHITEFPERINSLASIYYEIAGSPKNFTYINIFPLYGPSGVERTDEGKRFITLWTKFLRECIDFRLTFRFFPPQVFNKLFTFIGRSPEEAPESEYESRIFNMNKLIMKSAGGKRKRSTRIRRSRRRIRRSRRRIRSRHNKSTRKYISNT